MSNKKADCIKILDVKGKLIEKGSIVGMSDNNGNWSEFQGLVVDPQSNIEDDGYCVAVFFNLEVDPSRFFIYSSNHKREIISVGTWDREYSGECKVGKTDFLFINEWWKK